LEELRLITGDIQTYTKIEDIRIKLPEMARAMTEMVRLNTSGLPRLALAPVRLTGGGDSDGANSGNADTLAQILAIYIAKNGKYAVYPRTSSLGRVQSEYEDDRLPIPYEGGRPNMTLSVTARKLGGHTMFNAAIIDMTSMGQTAGDSVDYDTLDDGILAMKSLALKLSGINMNYMAGSAEDFSKAVDEINSSDGSGWEYSIMVDGDFALNGVSFTSDAQKTIILSGKSSACALSSGNTSALFTVSDGVTLILDKNIVLRGGGRDSVIVDVRGGMLVMRAGSLIRGGGRGGVMIRGGGKFRMEGGAISGNARESGSGGGGVYVGIGSVFTMEEGIIHDNYAKYGGGVYVSGMGARFTMTGGAITGNDAVYGGGVCVSGVGAEFVMTGGVISKNPAKFGGGVYAEGGRFVKTGGGQIETGSPPLGEDCVFIFNGGKIRKSAAGPDVRLDSLKTGEAGGWE
jgi:hypothetical protein